MEIVKAVINTGEVTFQLEGPRDFVEKYLDQYDLPPVVVPLLMSLP